MRYASNVDGSQLVGDWRDQWCRVRRYYDRIRDFDEGKTPAKIDPRYCWDDIISFFIHCHHMQDWLISNPPPQPRPATWNKCVKDYIRDKLPLSMCENIANTNKHFERNNGTLPLVSILSGFSSQTDGLDFQRITMVFYSSAKDPNNHEEPERTVSEIDAFELATKCVEEWAEFIRKHYGPVTLRTGEPLV